MLLIMRPNMDKVGQLAYVMSEWDQSWVHYRHLESMRGQYLGFFFTAVLGVTAVAGPRLIDDSLRTAGSLAVVTALLAGLQTLAAFLYLAVARMNVAIGVHADRIKAIRDQMIPASREVVDLGPFAGAPRANKPWASTSGVATHVLALALFPFALAGALARSVQITGISVLSRGQTSGQSFGAAFLLRGSVSAKPRGRRSTLPFADRRDRRRRRGRTHRPRPCGAGCAGRNRGRHRDR